MYKAKRDLVLDRYMIYRQYYKCKRELDMSIVHPEFRNREYIYQELLRRHRHRTLHHAIPRNAYAPEPDNKIVSGEVGWKSNPRGRRSPDHSRRWYEVHQL